MNPAVRRAIECLAPSLPPGSKIFLFGSQAEGHARTDSDIDLFIVEPQVDNRIKESVRLSSLLGRALIAGDVVVQDETAFAQQRRIPNTLAWHVARKGIECGIEC